MVDLMEHQEEAVRTLGNGKILWGGVGTGKSLAVIAYYVEKEAPRNICVITTAKKRDSLDWQGEAAKFGISENPEISRGGYLVVDSWNNIKKYEGYDGWFFVFDEQRVVGSGAWVKSFLKITRKNRWVLLSATPGDTWMDYIPVFLANGYYRSASEFKRRHVLYEPFVKFPKIKGYLHEGELEEIRNNILVEMPFVKETERMVNYLDVEYDRKKYLDVVRNRWNIYDDQPIENILEMFHLARRVVNSDPSRIQTVRKLLWMVHPKLIIFYTFNYELDILRTLADDFPVAEWNGHKKEPIPDEDCWAYLVQYTSGAEGWNCVETDAMLMYSMTYSYKTFIQAQGRIDRLNTSYKTLYYYVLASHSAIDEGIRDALSKKKSFNEKKFITERGKFKLPEDIFEV